MSVRFKWERDVKASDLPRTTKFVLLTLATHANAGGKAWPSQVRLAGECGLSERSVRKHLADALELGWLERTRKGQKIGRAPEKTQTSEYVLRFPTGTSVPVPEQSPTGDAVPVPNLQPEPDGFQPEPGDSPTGTGLPPISKDQSKNQSPHADLPRESDHDADPFGESLKKEEPKPRVPELAIFEKAKKLGKQLASLTHDRDVVEAQFQSDRLLRNFPEVLHTVVTNWEQERIRMGLEPARKWIV